MPAGIEPCRSCGSRALVRSRRRGWERALTWLGLMPYRCLGCDKRCYRFGAAPTRAA